jgi:protein kinase A
MTSTQAAPQPSSYGAQPSSSAPQQNVPSIQSLLNNNSSNNSNQPAQSFHQSQVSNGGAIGSTMVPDPAQQPQPRTTKGKYTLTDFHIQRTLGTGSFGRVHLVQSRHNQRYYAVKVLKKAQVVKMKQVEHTNDERKMLQRVKHPFLITLWGTFQDCKNLYMVMDFIEGGELFSLLRKSQVSQAKPARIAADQIYNELTLNLTALP